MTSLRLSQIELPAADLGPKNPLAPLRPLGLNANKLKVDDSVPTENRKHLDYGTEPACLPYRFQDAYNRDRRMRQFPVIILENDILTATFLPSLGGRLYSLHHKPTGRELLHRNPVFQPANLATRNAWFSGGVEWNVSIPGHCPFTCEPVFAARLQMSDGTPVLRMYEFERIRRLPWQIDCFLPEGSPVLFVRPRLVNPHAREIPMYWWSNIAVDQTPFTRVLAPATEAFTLGVEFEMKMVPFPEIAGKDMSRARNIRYASDYFYRMPEMPMPWIAAIDGTGTGLFHASTPRLAARKTFYWGTQPGGRQWQKFLSTGPSEYLEIQAGLAPTQAECIPMPAHADWSWLEAYGRIDTDPVLTQANWHNAVNNAQTSIENTITPGELESKLRQTESMADACPTEILYKGSGWAALENKLCEKQNTPSPFPRSVNFPPDTVTEAQQPWLNLLETGTFPYRPPHAEPGSYMTETGWMNLLKESIDAGLCDHWLSWLHIGVMQFDRKDFTAAKNAWQTSLDREPSAWAYRNLAQLELLTDGSSSHAAQLYLRAVDFIDNLPQLTIECANTLIDANRWTDLENLLVAAPPNVRSHSRIQLATARLQLHKGQYEQAARTIEAIELHDLREAESTLTDLWIAIHTPIAEKHGLAAHAASILEDYPIPQKIDFRMLDT